MKMLSIDPVYPHPIYESDAETGKTIEIQDGYESDAAPFHVLKRDSSLFSRYDDDWPIFDGIERAFQFIDGHVLENELLIVSHAEYLKVFSDD